MNLNTMTKEIKRTRTGFKYTILYVHESERICKTTIRCTQVKDVLQGEIRAYNHIKTHHLGFNRFPSYNDLNTLPAFN